MLACSLVSGARERESIEENSESLFINNTWKVEVERGDNTSDLDIKRGNEKLNETKWPNHISML